MKRLTVVVASNDAAAREQAAQMLSARNYRIVQAGLNPGLLSLYDAEAHDVGLLLPDGDESIATYKDYRAAVAPRGVKVVVAGGGDAAKAAADAVKDRFLAGPPERDALLHAIEQASRHLITILVADDEPLIRKMFSMFLAGQGYKVVTAEDGADAIQKVKEVLPDLVITDIKMPHIDGYELCRAIKESRETQHIPVIIVSALGGELDVDRGFNAGANEYVTKPVDLHDLGQRIQSIFRGIAMRGREKVMIAVWSQIERSMLEYGLAQQGFEVMVVRDAEQAFEAAKRTPPGVLVADYDLSAGTSQPGTATATAAAGGQEMLSLRERLKAEKATRDLPLVVLLGRNQKIDGSKREKLDAAAFMAKPYSAERLVSVIERILGERRLKLEVEANSLLQAITALVNALEGRD
ncbi:MAG TPA: response regulator, partial [Planctomycetota bacterium]|nr:response regulator [Planctomycetota bacterium]